MSAAWKVKRLDPDAPYADNARRILAVRIAEFYSWGSIVDDDDNIPLLHQLRISAKRLRYTLELFDDVFGETGRSNAERVRRVQDLLGQLHDHDVRIELIEDELRVLAAEQLAELRRSLATASAADMPAVAKAALRPAPDDPRRGLVNLLGRQYASRLALVEAFRAYWRELEAEGMRDELNELSLPPHATSATP